MAAPTILCISSYFKGNELMQAAKAEGCRVLLLTEEKLRHKPWAFDAIDEIFTMQGMNNPQWVVNTVSWIYRNQKIDRVIPLDEFEVLSAAMVREHLLIPGMGYTATRPFRDKLTMRIRTQEAGIKVPAFVGVLNHDEVREFIQRVPAPWVLKPRTSAGAMGIKKIHSEEELWNWLNVLNDEQSERLLEQYIPGNVYHVDSIVIDGKIAHSTQQKYGAPPMNVSHEGGVFSSMTLAPTSADAKALRAMNEKVIPALGLNYGVTHAEYIKAHADDTLYFLECAARVGGAHLADLIEASTGINLWAEWAKMEAAAVRGEKYKAPKGDKKHAALLVSLARQQHPDTSAYNDPEVVWRLAKEYHAGLVVASEDRKRVEHLLNTYGPRFVEEFVAVAPPLEHPDQASD